MILPSVHERTTRLASVTGDARTVLDAMTPGRVVNLVTLECALDPRLNRHPPDLEDGEDESYRGGRADLERWKERQPIAEMRARAALAELMLLGLVEDDVGANDPSPRNQYFKRTSWR